MRDIILIRVGEELDGSASWLRMGDAIKEPFIEQGPLEEAEKKSIGARVVGLVPSSAVLLTYAQVPTTNKQRMLKAIPFALEEDLASDVEDLHFAIGDPTGEGRVPVAVVNRHMMEMWQNQFRDAGISVDVLIPDVFAVPNNPSQWNLLIDGNTAIMRTGEQSGSAFDAENLGFMLPLLIKEKEEEDLPEAIELWSEEQSSELMPLTTDNVEVHSYTNNKGILGLVSKENLDISKAINLLQGAFSRSEQIGKYLRPWRVAAGLLAAWFFVALTSAVIESSRLDEQSEALRAEAVAIYKKTFPEAKRVVNPRVQMKQKLEELKRSDSGGGSGFMTLLADSGQVFRATSGLVLRSVRFKNGVLDVDLELPNLQTLDQLKQKLTDTKKLSVEIQSAASRNNKVQGRMQIKSKSS